MATFVSRADVSRVTSDLIGQLMQELASNTEALAEVVAGGAFRFRTTFLRTFKGLPVDDDVANAVFAFLTAQYQHAHPDQPAGAWLDAHAPASPPTEAEIAKSWVVESASSEQANQQYYGDHGHPQGLLDRIVSEDYD